VNYFLGVLGKNLKDLRTDEVLVLVVMLVVSLLLVSYAVRVFLRQFSKFVESQPKPRPSESLRFRTVGSLRDYADFNLGRGR
jgi:hypothetical protein